MFRTVQPTAIRALIIGDSLGAPRPHRGQVLASTWPVLLKTAFPRADVWQRCRAAAMSPDVLKEFHLFSDSLDGFDLLVVQVGIGDCCPRPYPLFLEKFILTYGFRRLHKWLNAHYPALLKFRSRPWVSREEYIANLNEIISTTRARNPRTKVCVIKIGTPHGEFVRKVANVPAAAAAYNQALEILCRAYGPEANVALLSPYDNFAPEDLFIADGHHLSVLGHQVVARALEPHFAALVPHSAAPSPATPAGSLNNSYSVACPASEVTTHSVATNIHVP